MTEPFGGPPSLDHPSGGGEHAGGGRRERIRPETTLALGFGDERPAVALSIGAVERRAVGRPEVTVRLERALRPPVGSEPFSPYRLPSEVAVQLSEVDFGLLSSVRAELELRLRPGRHAIPLTNGSPAQIEYGQDATAHVTIDVSREELSDSRPVPIVRRVDVRFDRPVVIHNVLQALAEVRTLFEDRTVGAIFQSAPAREAWTRLQGLLPERLRELGGWIEESDSIGVVLLDRAEARARWRRRTRTWDLRVGFSGRVRLAGGVVRPFVDVELPNVLLPTPHARLDRLLSDTPLVSAAVSAHETPALAFLRALLGSACDARGRVKLLASLPQLLVATPLIDGTEVEAALRLADEVNLEGPFQIDFGDTKSRIELQGLRLLLPQEGLALDAELDVSHDLSDGDRPLSERFEVGLRVAILEGSALPAVGLVYTVSHPLLVGQTELPLVLADVRLDGSGALSLRRGGVALWPTVRRLRFSGAVLTDPAALSEGAKQRVRMTLDDGRFEGTLDLEPGGIWRVAVQAEAAFREERAVAARAIPEFMVDEGELTTIMSGRGDLDLRLELSIPQPNAAKVDFRGTSLTLSFDEVRAQLGLRVLCLPQGTTFCGEVTKGRFSAGGLSPTTIELSWDLHGAPCTLSAGPREVSLLAEGLRRGALTVKLLAGGRLELGGSEEGLYGVKFWNALLEPTAHLDTWWEVLRSEEALLHVIKALEVFAPELADTLADLRQFGLTLRAMLEREGVREPRDLIPRERLAHFLSILLAGNTTLHERLVPIIQGVTEGRGLPVRAVKAILWEQLEDLPYDYEVDWIVRWLDLLLRPSEPLPRPEIEDTPPLAEDPRYAAARAGLPSAGQIYHWAAEGKLTPAQVSELAQLAPYLSLAQLEWLSRASGQRLNDSARAELRYAYELKRRVRGISDAYGGVRFAPQAPWIATLLGEAVGAGAAIPEAREGYCALGPEEVATLLQTGLATARQGRATQRNNRLLIDLMRARPAAFTLEVLVELGHQNPRALAGALFAFLDQDQDELREKLDLPALIEAQLGLPVPRQQDFLAGGLRARESYTAALDTLAAAILACSGAYLSCKAHLQTARHRPRGAPNLTVPTTAPLAKRAEAAIAAARRAGALCRFRDTPKAARSQAAEERRRSEAAAAYEAAFDACRSLLAAEPMAVTVPWFRRFWAENEEALVVHSVVTNYEEDLDRVRYWLHRRKVGREFGEGSAHSEEELADRARALSPIEDRQALLDSVIDTLYVTPRDREELRRDPLVRLLLPPPPGKYEFTIVSAMGVITEGARGRELEDAYRRLTERRGVRALRADTATGRSLEYNAERLLEVVRQTRTPWGYVGYSQGCANGLLAESLLRCGTPSEQRLLDRFVARKLLFSAANGSAHGTSGAGKLAQALARGEWYLKPYQATFSRPVTEAFHRVVRAALDSRTFVHAMGGCHSLTFERAIPLHRDLQFMEHILTSTTLGASMEPFVPEVLEYMQALLDVLQPGTQHDSQVVVEDARGQSTAVRNVWTRAVARADSGSRVQAIHHWSPLSHEAEFVTTTRDRLRAVYDGPKDRHVFPWVEVNARFGRIAVREG